MRNFEFDEKKSQSNLKKHGINFVDAQLIWEDPNYVEIHARTVDEPRSLIIGLLDGKHWSAIVTHRNESIRIISVRRSRKPEVAIYES